LTAGDPAGMVAAKGGTPFGAMAEAPGTGKGELAALIAGTAAGDRRAFAALYGATSAKLFGVALRILRRRDLAEEALQESFIAVWQRARSFDPEKGEPMTWLIAILRHRAIDQLRRRAARVEGQGQSEAALLTMAAGEDSRADRGAELGALERCLELLEPPARQAVMLAYAYGFTHAELAARLPAPIGTVKSWIRRGLERLKRCLDG
jgi:RNA polymerase sigma-70 factor, ECF subfamily